MFYSELIQRAFSFSIQVHELDGHEKRKGTEVPYVTHAFIVAFITARVTDNENTIAGAGVHDTVENCKPYGSVTIALLAQLFNPEVARIVSDVTEPDKSLPWMERKMQAIAHLEHMPQDSLIVKSADVLHNLSDMNQELATIGRANADVFNTSLEHRVQRYVIMIPKLREVWPGNPLLPELEAALAKLLVLAG